MRLSKRAGGGVVSAWSAEEAGQARRAALVTARLRLAIASESLVAHLQPVVEIATGRTRGLEVLARWHDEQLGEVRPDEFVPLAEASGLVRDLDRVVLRSALRTFVASGAAGRDIRLALNASPSELRCPSFLDELRVACTGAGVPLSLVTVEVTESAPIAPGDAALETLEQLAALGVTVAIDDFGTGYSSLGYLERLPARIVKIDRSMVLKAADPRGRAVLEAVVGVCRALSLDVVAEGVEDEATAAVIAELGIVFGQGWLWSKALAPSELAAHLDAGPRVPAP